MNRKILSLTLVLMLVFSMGSFSAFAEEAPKAEAATTAAPAAAVEQVTNVIDILTLNDFHGSVMEAGKNIGMSKMIGYVEGLKEKNPNTLIVSAGDNYQGTAISNLTFGAPVTEMFKALELTASAVGNHEFDWGASKIEQWSKDGGFPYLAANIYDKATGEPVTWAKPYIVKEVNGVKIGFIGLSTVETSYMTAQKNVKDLEFKPAAEAAKTWVEFLKAGKAEEGTPDIIIALTHVPSKQDKETKAITGEELNALTLVEGIDAVISGHSHKTVSGTINDVPVVQAYKNGRCVGKLSIELNEDKTVKAITPSVEAVYKISADLVPDPEGEKTFKEFEAKFEPIASEVVGKLENGLSHDRKGKNVTELGYWVCKVMAEKTESQIAITNGGGIRRSLEAGDVTMSDLYEIMPFDNTLVTMDVTGEHLKKLVDHGIEADFMTDGQFYGVVVEYDPAQAYESRITKITLADGTPVEMDKTYKIVTNDFIITGGDKYDFEGSTNLVNTYVPIRDVLTETFKAVDTVSVEIPVVITAIEAAPAKEVPAEEVVPAEVVPATPVVPAKPATTTEKVYIVKVNDKLWKIAKQHNMDYKDLAKHNKLDNPHKIFVGQKLLIPAM